MFTEGNVRCGQGTGENDWLERKFPAGEYFFSKLVVSQQVKKILHFYGNWMFITVFTSARHWTLWKTDFGNAFFLFSYIIILLFIYFVYNTPSPSLKVTSLQIIIVQRHIYFFFLEYLSYWKQLRKTYNFNSSTFL